MDEVNVFGGTLTRKLAINSYLGQRLGMDAAGVIAHYVMDTSPSLSAGSGLTQVLADGTNTYLYGNGRIAQVGTTTEYFMGETPRVYRATGFGCGGRGHAMVQDGCVEKTLGVWNGTIHETPRVY